MTTRHVAVALVLTVVAATVGVGASSSPSATGGVATPTNTTAPLGQSISTFMQANAAQTAGTVENGMWVAAFANASNASVKRALVERRVGELNGSLAELKAERRALRTAFENGTINRTTYVAQLSTIVGRLAAIGEGIEETGAHGETVGVNRSRLDALRSQARNLSGAEVSRLARNLTGDRGPPGPPGLFEDGPPGQSGDRGPPNATNRTDGPPGNVTGGPDDPGQSGKGEGPPTGNDQGQGQQPPTATETETEP